MAIAASIGANVFLYGSTTMLIDSVQTTIWLLFWAGIANYLIAYTSAKTSEPSRAVVYGPRCFHNRSISHELSSRQIHKYLRVYPQWRFAPPRVQITRPVERFGSEYGGYCLDGSMIGCDAVVYSLGIGEDISFDLSLIERFGVEVDAFDPTPKVKKWLATQSLPRQFHFHDAGIAGHDGEETFYIPTRKLGFPFRDSGAAVWAERLCVSQSFGFPRRCSFRDTQGSTSSRWISKAPNTQSLKKSSEKRYRSRSFSSSFITGCLP